MKRFVYVDNAATTMLDVDAFEAMKPYLLDRYGNASQPYSFSRANKNALGESRKMIADCINASPDEIFFTSGGTESDNWAIKGSFFSGKQKRIITSEIEHHAILNSVKAVKKMGCDIFYVKPNPEGIVIPEKLSDIITTNTRLVSIMLANNEIGTIQPIKKLSKIAHQSGSLFHTDAVQAIGHIKVDVQDLNIDMLSASAHKFNGPKGIGFLYIKKGTPIAPYMDGGSQECLLRAGTENVASIVGMAYALKKNYINIKQNAEHIRRLERQLIEKLNVKKRTDIIKNGGCNTIPGNISLSFLNYNGEALLHRLDLKGIYVSTGSACDSKNVNISHVLKVINLDKNYAKGTIRISLGKDNTIEDIDYIVKTINSIIER